MSVLGVAGICAADAGWMVARAQQPQDPSVPSLFEPHFEDTGRGPQNFRRPGDPATPATPSSSSAGTTGFDATNAKVKRKTKEQARRRAADDAAALPPIVSSGPDRTVPGVFQRQESGAALRRRAINTAAASLDATGAIAPRPMRRRIVEDDPFGPTGFRSGAFIVRPAIDVSGGYNSNPGQRPGIRGSTFEQTTGKVDVRSDWLRHQWNTNLRGSYIWYNDLPQYSKPDVRLRTDGRIDISKQTRVNFDGYFGLAADNPGDPNLPNDVASPPLYYSTGGTAGITHNFNRLFVTLRGGIDRIAYSDAELNNGGLLDLRDRNYNQYGLRLRVGYETLPGITPFVEGGIDRRVHDRTISLDGGVNRDSDGQQFRVGSTFELSRYLVGEISAGMLQREYVDPNFNRLHGVLLDANLIYYATPLTTLRLEAHTGVNESILTGVSGSLSRDVGFQIEHAFRRWLIGTARFGYGTDDYIGSPQVDQRYILSGGLIYKMTRDIHWRAEYRREWLNSTFPGRDYVANIITVGVRLMR